MEQKSINTKIKEAILSSEMPRQSQGEPSRESGLIILLSDDATQVVATYGSAVELTTNLVHIMHLNEGVRKVILGAFAGYKFIAPDDPYIKRINDDLDNFINNYMK